MSANKNTPLQQLIAVEQDARQFGFEWPHTQMVIDQAVSECAEIQDAIEQNESRDRIQEEIGDLLHTAISLCIFEGFDVEQTLAISARKFEIRMNALKSLTQGRGLENLQGKSTEFMMDLWRELKLAEKPY